MIKSKWSANDPHVDEIDPGKDIFALLFLSFFLINAVIMICVSHPGEQRVNVNAVSGNSLKIAVSSNIAQIRMVDKNLSILQGGTTYRIPNELNLLKTRGKFHESKDAQGNPCNTLIVKDPGKSIMAGDLIRIVDHLNKAGIGVDFRIIHQ